MHFNIYSRRHIDRWLRPRAGEVKIGEMVNTLDGEWDEEALKNSEAEFVMFGLPEDIGVQANLGRPGTWSAWRNMLPYFLNTQNNRYLQGSQVLILGELRLDDLMHAASSVDLERPETLERAYENVSKIDAAVSEMVAAIVRCGKHPIAIGGGHNNAYPMLKGWSEGSGQKINAINFDAHTDFRAMEGRHSGNGFRYAFEENILKKYFMFGLHEGYTPESVYEEMDRHTGFIDYNFLEDMLVRKINSFDAELLRGLNFVKEGPFGVELDMDSIQYMPSSAQTSVGYSINDARRFVDFMARFGPAAYLHVCEAAPELAPEDQAYHTGKALSYIVSDYIKARNSNYDD